MVIRETNLISSFYLQPESFSISFTLLDLCCFTFPFIAGKIFLVNISLTVCWMNYWTSYIDDVCISFGTSIINTTRTLYDYKNRIISMLSAHHTNICHCISLSIINGYNNNWLNYKIELNFLYFCLQVKNILISLLQQALKSTKYNDATETMK